MYGLSLEAYETAQQLGEGEKYATVGRIKSHAALNNQTPLFEILASNPSVSHIDPVWYYSYIFEVFLEMIQENGVNEDLQKDLELRWQSIIEDSGNENAYSSLYLYALEKISEHQSRTTDIITWALGFRPSGSSNDDAGNLSDTDYISTLSGETTSESIKETYKMLRKIVEDLKSRGLYEQAFNFCSFGIVFYYDVNRYNLEVNDENHDIIQDSNSSVQISCSSDYNSIVISPDSSLPYDTEDVSHQPIRIEVDLANQTDEQTTSNSFENVIKDFAEEIIRQNTR